MARAAGEVDALRKSHPTASGRLAGVDGRYADTLAKLLADPPRRPPPTGGGEWTAFAGNPARDGRATGRLPRYWPTRPTWQTAFPPAGERPAVTPTPTARSVPYHPVVLGGVGYVADPLRVFAFDPLTGAGAVAFDLRRDARFDGLPVEGVAAPTADADFTLTAAAGKLYGRFGRFPPPAAPDETNRPSDFLLCLAPTSRQLEVRWWLPPPARDGAVVAWEAAPVWLDGRVYAAFTRLDGTTRTFAVAAYADPPGNRPLWVTEVATARAGAAPRVRQEPLTVAGGRLVYCTHAGSVVALDPATGKPAWAVAYPEPRRRLPAPARDLCPPLAAGGRVFVAPLDSDVLLALDAATGRELWAADGLLADQLLGVSRGRLVATVAGPQKGIRGFDAATGSDREPAGWRQHDDPQLASFGRGLVTDDLILWPTRQGLFPLEPGVRPAGRPAAARAARQPGVRRRGTAGRVADRGGRVRARPAAARTVTPVAGGRPGRCRRRGRGGQTGSGRRAAGRRAAGRLVGAAADPAAARGPAADGAAADRPLAAVRPGRPHPARAGRAGVGRHPLPGPGRPAAPSRRRAGTAGAGRAGPAAAPH